MCLAGKQQIPLNFGLTRLGIEHMNYSTLDKHTSHNTADVVSQVNVNYSYKYNYLMFSWQVEF